MKPVFFPFRAAFNASVPHLRLAIVQVEPYVNKRRIGDQVEVWGPISQIAEAVQSITRHKFSIVLDENMPHGYRLKNGSFYGLMGYFQRDEIDMLMSPAIMNAERLDLAQPATFEITSFRLLTWSPSKIVDPFNFASAFKLEVWLGVLISFLLLSVVCWILDRFLTPWDATKPLALIDYVWDLFSRFFPQDAPLQEQSWFRMCLMGFLLAFSLIFMTFLSSALTSSMTIRGEEDFVNSFADVLRFPNVRIYAEKGTTFQQMFTQPSNQVFRRLNSSVIPVRGILQLSSRMLDRVPEIEARKRVIVASPDTCAAIIIKRKGTSGKCPNIMMSTESAGLMAAALFISKNLPAKTRDMINKGVMIALESHIYRKTLLWSLKEYEKCRLRTRSASAADLKALSLLDLQGCFVLIAIGFGAASASLSFEIVKQGFYRRTIPTQ